MNRNQRVALLIACALALAVGSYIILSQPSDEASVYRQAISPAEQEPAKAPSWVETGQDSKPDYSPTEAEAHNATPVSEPELGTTQVIEVTEDKVVTFSFVESLADFMLNGFSPRDKQGKPATMTSARSANIYFGNELDGFAVTGDDIRTARQSVLDYVFTPEMLETLADLYTPVFMAHIVDTARTDQRQYRVGSETELRTLSDPEISAMLRLNALKMDQASSMLHALANDSEITALAGKYLGAAKAVERANAQLQTAIAEDKKNTAQSGQRLKQAILQRERLKASVVSRLKKACPSCSDADLFYIAQWGYRRVLNEPDKRLKAFSQAADILSRIAEEFRSRAANLN